MKRRRLLLTLLTGGALSPAVPSALAQVVERDDEPLLPAAISERDVEMRGRYVRQWKQDDGTLVLMFTGGFRLDMGGRRMSSTNSVVWITPHRSEPDGRKYYSLTVYLSEQADVLEPGGTLTQDNVLLVSNLRTYGRIVKYHDAHGPEEMEQSPLYQRALRDWALIEAGEPPPTTGPRVGVRRPATVRRPKTERAPRRIRYEFSEVEPVETSTGEQLFVVRGRVYFSQSGGPDAPFLEIQATNAVVFPAEGAAASILGSDIRGDVPVAPDAEPGRKPERARQDPDTGPDDLARVAQQGIRAVYLEGDVILSFGSRLIRADRLYYDFENDRALILDAVFRTEIPGRDIPLYIRADEIRQLSAREYSATPARVSTSEFYTPHYHVGAERVLITDRTVRDTTGLAASKIAGSYQLEHTTLNVEGFPLAYWPYAKGDFESSETGLRRFRASYGGDFGTGVETAWHLFNLLGLAAPPGYDATLKLDYFSERGPAVGIDADYQQEDHFGLLRSYYIHDDGRDDLGPLRAFENELSSKNRGRVLWRHRHFLPNDWEATFEISYISDPNFLETYENSEFNEGKEQETLIYLKRAWEKSAVTLLANWRLLDFTTQTEHLPDLTYRRIGDTLLSPLVFYHESRLGAVRYRPDDRRFFDSRRLDNTSRTNTTFRIDVREEVELPLKLAGLNIVPFGMLRGSYWDGAAHHAGGLWRGFATYGARGGTSLSRVYDVSSELWDINGIRHIIKPDFVAWFAHSNVRSDEITPFDEGIETIEDFYGASVGIRQTWQTKRGAPGRERSVDLLTFNLEAGFFGDAQRDEKSNGYVNPLRPEDSRSRNYLAGDLIYRLSDTTSLLYDFNFDLNDGQFDRHNVSLAVERLPRTAYVFGLRHASDIDMTLVGGGFNYRLNEKHITTARAWYDIERGDLGEFSIAYVRRLPRWYFAVNFEYDNVDNDLSVTVSLWPEGIPEWAIGSRRFTGLSTTTGIRP
ncbi:MAG: LPS assembly protein LptD [Planctomycetes bacterium]|nr:LPS assembly protein LptD [Planctomycetota bacterium]